MKYIIMCGRGTICQVPKQMVEIKGVPVVKRTINLLRQNGVEDIAISTNNDAFGRYEVPLLKHKNEGRWINGFYPMDEPVCYIFGDVVFSPEAIKTIVETETNDIEFFASAPPFGPKYPKGWAEPFAFKVQNTKRFFECVKTTNRYADQHLWKRDPIAWELWQIIKGGELNEIDYTNYVAINDYTCDIDWQMDVAYYNNSDI